MILRAAPVNVEFGHFSEPQSHLQLSAALVWLWGLWQLSAQAEQAHTAYETVCQYIHYFPATGHSLIS